uniref:Uncharacterized protein n=1 Tax=Cacopsylla melanoneura TaxID=428564 RepID=A0A8D8RLM2_9HEMI
MSGMNPMKTEHVIYKELRLDAPEKVNETQGVREGSFLWFRKQNANIEIMGLIRARNEFSRSFCKVKGSTQTCYESFCKVKESRLRLGYESQGNGVDSNLVMNHFAR